MIAYIQKHWIFRLFLIPLAFFYRVLVGLRRALYFNVLNRVELPGNTISIGNLYVGGTGKTPTVIAIAQYFARKNKHVVVLSRGYKSGLKNSDFGLYSQGKLMISNGLEVNHKGADEPALIHFRAGVDCLYGVDRGSAARWYLQSHPVPDLWILDDGFQHLKLRRNLDIILFDHSRDLSKENVFPAGLLREPLISVNYADAILFTRCKAPFVPNWVKGSGIEPAINASLIGFSRQIEDGFFLVDKMSNMSQVTVSQIALLYASFVFVCGTANPQTVLFQLKSQKLEPHRSLILSDHGEISPSEMNRLGKKCSVVITTEKDYFRDEEVFVNNFQTVIIKRISFEIPSTTLGFIEKSLNI